MASAIMICSLKNNKLSISLLIILFAVTYQCSELNRTNRSIEHSTEKYEAIDYSKVMVSLFKS